MRFFANIFLILFFADGSLSLLDEIFSLGFSLHAFSGVRDFLANFVIVMAVPLYICLGIDKRLHKRVFLPLILFALWCPVSVLVFPTFAEYRAYGLLMAAAQVLLCMLPISCFRKGDGRSLVMPKAMFDAPFFSARNTVTFFTANIFAVPVALAVLAYCVANSYMAGHTAGFMRLAPDGLRMTEKVYTRGDKTIRLAAMIHVGEKEYYEKLAGLAAGGRAIVLAEGVTDDKRLLKDGIDYRKLASFLGLASQEKMLLKGRLIDEAELENPSPERNEDRGDNAGSADILRADVDISSFRPQTVRILDEFGRHMKESPSLSKGLMSYNAWAEKNITEESYEVLMADILHNRNRVVIGHLRKAVGRYDTIVIPWGAMHMPEIEEEVLKQGFKLRQENERISIDLRKMLSTITSTGEARR